MFSFGGILECCQLLAWRRGIVRSLDELRCTARELALPASWSRLKTCRSHASTRMQRRGSPQVPPGPMPQPAPQLKARPSLALGSAHFTPRRIGPGGVVGPARARRGDGGTQRCTRAAATRRRPVAAGTGFVLQCVHRVYRASPFVAAAMFGRFGLSRLDRLEVAGIFPPHRCVRCHPIARLGSCRKWSR